MIQIRLGATPERIRWPRKYVWNESLPTFKTPAPKPSSRRYDGGMADPHAATRYTYTFAINGRVVYSTTYTGTASSLDTGGPSPY